MTEIRPLAAEGSVAARAALPVQAIDQIGTSAADEIERTADRLEQEAKDKADKLRLFASKIREQSRQAAEAMAAHCAQATDIFTTIQNLETRLDRDRGFEAADKLAALAEPREVVGSITGRVSSPKANGAGG